MARLDKNPAPGDWGVSNGSYEENDARHERQLKALEAEGAKSPDGVTGAVLQFPYADGFALYRVSKAKPLTLQHIPYGDAWHLPGAHIRGLTLKDVQAQLKSLRRFAAKFASLGLRP